MMLFGSRDIENLGHFFSGDAHSTFLVRRGGFHATEVAWLQGQFLKGQEANLLTLSPENGKKSISVEQVRVLVTSLSLGSRSANERRLVVVSSKLGTQAQNALLKIVEEPPRGVYFLLLADSEDDYLATIRSRSQLIKLNGPSEKEALGYAGERGIGQVDAKMLWLQSGGEAHELMVILEDSNARKKSLEYLADAKNFIKENDYGKLMVLKKYVSNKEEATELIKNILVVIELVASRGAKEALSVSGLAKRLEIAQKNLSLNTNLRLELLGLVV